MHAYCFYKTQLNNWKMGEAEINSYNKTLIIHSHIITYGNAANEALTESIRDEIETMWNEPEAIMNIQRESFLVRFHITAAYKPLIDIDEIVMNTDACNNYFRIEEYARGNISFVDALGCNTGYFMLENLYKGSTTAAHEYGHTLGLDHPSHLDIRGKVFLQLCTREEHWLMRNINMILQSLRA
jgi:hypothetical protein